MIQRKSEIVQTALSNLEANTGIVGYWVPEQISHGNSIDGKTTIIIGGTEHTFKTEVQREFREYHIDKLLRQAESHKPFMLVADRVFPAQKQRLRKEGIAYLDTAGNIYVSNGEQLIWIDGQKAVHVESNYKKTNRAFTKAGLKVVFAMLQNPDAVNYTYRQIASFAGVALGTVNEAMAALKETGYLLEVNKTRMVLNNKKELFEQWLVGYKNILKPSLLLGTYYFGGTESWKKIELPTMAAWGGEPAGDLETKHLNPEQWTIYTAGPKVELIKFLRLAPRADGNLKIYEQFWMDAVFDSKIPVTPQLITYADLMITGDTRCIETAGIIFDNKLSHMFDQL